MTAPACLCCTAHRPPPLHLDSHHLWPIFLGGPPHPATLVSLCQTTHANVHRILAAMVKAQAWLPRRLGQPVYAHHLATLGFQAWQAAGEASPPT